MGLLFDCHVCGVPCGIIRVLLCTSCPQSKPSNRNGFVTDLCTCMYPQIILCNWLAIHGNMLTKFIQTVVSSSISDSTSIFGKDGWWEAFESGYILKQLCWSQLISPGIYSRTVNNIPHLELLLGTHRLFLDSHPHIHILIGTPIQQRSQECALHFGFCLEIHFRDLKGTIILASAN